MLSVSAIKSAGKADYYAKDDYYIGKAAAPEETQLEWGGKGAERLGLNGHATLSDFKAVMEGRNPDPAGPELSKLERVQREVAATGVEPRLDPGHRPGTDLTFSAPKGLSVALLVGGDLRLAKAHAEAVREAMGYAEAQLSLVRLRGQTGERETRPTGELLYATTTHQSSREGDPQLHSHVVVANATYVAERGEWRALENKGVYENRVLIGQIYQSALAEKVQALGYDIRQHRSGTFELAAFSPDQLAAFSKATDRVERNLEQEKPETGAAKDLAKRLNRPRKLEIAPDQLQARWEREALEAGFDPKDVVAAAELSAGGRDVTDQREGKVSGLAAQVARITAALSDRFAPSADPFAYRSQDRTLAQDPQARAAVSYGLQVNEAQKAVFKRHEVYAAALQASPFVTIGRLERQLDQLVADGRVVKADATLQSGVTTARTLELEAAVVERMKAGLGQGRALYSQDAALERVSPDAVLRAGHDHAMNSDQTGAAALILSSPDRVIAVHGVAGGGKTTLFGVVVKAAAEKGMEFFGVSPSHSAKANLAEKAQTSAEVLSWVTTRYAHLAEAGARASPEERKAWKGRGIILDEASLGSNPDTHKLLRIAEALGVEKVVLVGDMRQHNSPIAGAPFRHLINEQIPLARIETIMRQKDPELHHIVSTLSKGEGTKGAKLLGDKLVEVGRGEGDTALALAAFDLWERAKDQGETRPIIVQTQLQRALVNELVLDSLERRGEATALGAPRDRLVSVPMSGPERFNAGSYELGQVLVFHRGTRDGLIQRQEHVEVVGIDNRGHVDLLTVAKADGRTASLDLGRMARRRSDTPFQVYERQTGGDLYVGAAMVWERSDAKRGLYTGESFTLVGERGEAVQLRLASGQHIEVSKSDPQLNFVGPGYAMTSHRSQSLTMETAPIGVMSSRLADVATLYVQASRGVHDYTLVTDDKALLIQRLGQETGMNLIASEEVEAAREKEAKEEPERDDPAKPQAGHEPQKDGELKPPPGWDNPEMAGEDISQRRPAMQKRIELDIPITFPDRSL